MVYSSSQDNPESQALLLIDIQEFYFQGSRPLDNPEKASANAAKILKSFRDSSQLVVHVQHQSDTLAEIHKNVAPLEGEKVFTKDQVNAFKGTGLLEFLRSKDIKNLVICGMMTHMCVEAAVRAANDLGFECTVISDACTTRDLSYGDRSIKAADVHYSTLSTLNRYYAQVSSTEKFLESLKK
ncbi:cysteine hydrolase family protein [Acidobacteriota bacterium]